MGIFDWFKTAPSNVKAHSDVIWLTKAAKLKGIVAAIARSRAERTAPDAIVLVAHFPDCLETLEKIAQIVASADNSTPVTATSAETLKDACATIISAGNRQSIRLIVGERHPLILHDEALLECAKGLPCRASLVHHIALDDAVMRAFGGDWVVTALKRLGMTDEESIESQMVVRRIRDAQKKLGRESINELPPDSAEAWMELNCPNVWFKSRR